ncbi:Uncharacterised protein [Vibrio cholerae]|uniref:Uncharacterized protein n=1 Tax=Vibrio cholerae TaxID=666 RepID=A0A655R9X2_VIBCL|nr:Uncharacterised protein [Vibrio cholerae]CSA93413.1 Uncharacterised protein [Vibrio cholerae]CSB04095.1 Uncharacterised protein [Vibrio cholerae]CSB17214.1 Uncharacterised protein [Vibrio cholerae]CSB65776.1 Uncharacterised protein [Vibrio cholerae]
MQALKRNTQIIRLNIIGLAFDLLAIQIEKPAEVFAPRIKIHVMPIQPCKGQLFNRRIHSLRHWKCRRI